MLQPYYLKVLLMYPRLACSVSPEAVDAGQPISCTPACTLWNGLCPKIYIVLDSS